MEKRFKIINGIRYDFLSSPTLLHQVLVPELWLSIRQTCHRDGIILVAPMDVHWMRTTFFSLMSSSFLMKPHTS